MIRKYGRIKRLVKSDGNELEGKSLYLTIFLGGDDGGWRGPVRILVDTGADTLVLPKNLLKRLGIYFEITGSEQSELADGSLAEFETGYVALKVITTDSVNPAFVEVPCSFTDEDVEPLFGQSLLKFFRYTVDGNEFVSFEVCLDLLEQLDDFKGRVKYVPATRDPDAIARIARLNSRPLRKSGPVPPGQQKLPNFPKSPQRPTAPQSMVPKPLSVPMPNLNLKPGTSMPKPPIISDANNAEAAIELIRQALEILEANNRNSS